MGFVLVACFAQESRMSGQTNARQQTGATDWKAVEQALDAAIEIALRTRPDLRLARLTEEVAQAGLRLARAQNAPEVTAFTRYSIHRSTFDNTPVGTLRDRDKLLTFGVSIGIPVFNRNQGAKAEAAAAISQAKARREFLEQVVRSEVTSAYARYEAARAALTTFEQGVIARSNENIRTIRAAYQLGAFRITDLLAEQRRLVDSQREFTEALAERYRALADRQVALGAPISPR
jgi:cobalt-zinc-cadmium efflux system outer membrane protein